MNLEETNQIIENLKAQIDFNKRRIEKLEYENKICDNEEKKELNNMEINQANQAISGYIEAIQILEELI